MKLPVNPSALLIAPPIYDFALFDLFLKPYALLSLGKALERAGYAVTLINALDYTDTDSLSELKSPKRSSCGYGKFFRQKIEKPQLLRHIERNYSRYGITRESLERKIASANPDVVLVSTGMTYWYPGVRESVDIVKKYHPEVPVIAGGIYATLCYNHAQKTIGADDIIRGDAFPALSETLARYSLPVPEMPDDYDLLLLPEINADAGAIRLNRGCPFRCRYCASSSMSGDFHSGDPAAAFSLVEQMYKQLGTRVFAFYDDALLVNKEKVFLPFLERVIASGMKLSFYTPNGIHLYQLEPETALLMKQAGFREVRIGFESADSNFHLSLDRKFSPESAGGIIELLLTAGFTRAEIGFYILAGLPGQYSEEVTDTVHYASRLGVRMYIAEYSPVPGSPLWEESVKHSRYPIGEEPLCQNNTVFPMEWEHFTMDDLEKVKHLAGSLSPKKIIA